MADLDFDNNGLAAYFAIRDDFLASFLLKRGQVNPKGILAPAIRAKEILFFTYINKFS
jgi:hypothetical protein